MDFGRMTVQLSIWQTLSVAKLLVKIQYWHCFQSFHLLSLFSLSVFTTLKLLSIHSSIYLFLAFFSL